MAEGIKISIDGADIDRATDSEMVLDSTKLGSIKVYRAIEKNLTATGVGGVETIEPHGLDYPPVFFATVLRPDDPFAYKTPFISGSETMKVYVDSVNVYFRVLASVGRTYQFKVVLFREEIVA